MDRRDRGSRNVARRRPTRAKKTLAIYGQRFIFTPVFVAGRRSVRPGNDGIAGRRTSKGPRARGHSPQVKKLMSLEEEPPSSAPAERSSEQSSVLKSPPQLREFNGHGLTPPVQLARAAGARFVISPASNEFRKLHFPGVKAAE